MTGWWRWSTTRGQNGFVGSHQKAFGPQYPQVLSVDGVGPDTDGLWTVYSVNKEDVAITFAPKVSLI